MEELRSLGREIVISIHYSREHSTRLFHFNWGFDGHSNGRFAIDYFVSDDADHYDDVNADNSFESNFGENTMLIYDILPSIHI